MNNVSISGYVWSDLKPFPVIRGAKMVVLAIPRKNFSFEDRIPCAIPERFQHLIKRDARLHFVGSMQTYFDQTGKKQLCIYVKKVYSGDLTFGENRVWYSGFVMKNLHHSSVLRDGNPFTIVDVACRTYKKNSAYVPTVLRGFTWEQVQKVSNGTICYITGEIHSRVRKGDRRITHEVLVESFKEGRDEEHQVKEDLYGEL